MAFLSQAFLDESNTGLDKPYFVLGGYVGGVEMWKDFSRDWQHVLDGKADGLPPWPPFHATYCEGGSEGFEALDDRQRKRRIGLLVDVIAKHKPNAILSVVNVPRFKAGLEQAQHKRRRKETWSHPYEFSAAHLVGNLASFHLATKKDFGSIEPVFDWMDRFSITTKQKIEERVMRFVEVDHPDLAGRVGIPRWPRPAERHSYVPLQAADLLVWHVARAKNAPIDGLYRRAFLNLKKVAPPKYCGPSGLVDLQDQWISGHWILPEQDGSEEVPVSGAHAEPSAAPLPSSEASPVES